MRRNPESPENPGNPGEPRRHRRQRSIRSTVTLLLIIPLVTLVGLLAFSLTKTVPDAIASHANTVTNDDIGGPLQNLLSALNAEELQTYMLGNLKAAPKQEQSLAPVRQETRSLAEQITGLRARTDAAVSAYRSGQAKLNGAGALSARSQPRLAALLAQLKNLPALRAEADHGTAPPLTVLQGYAGVIGAIFPYIGSTANANSSIPVFGQSMGTIYLGEALTDVATEAALGGGALASGGTVTAPVYRLFAQTVDQQRELEQTGLTELGFEKNFNDDPYVQALNSPQFKSFQSLENQVIAAGPGKRLPVSQQVWQQQATSSLGMLQQGATAERETVTRNAQHDSDLALYELAGVGGLGLLLVLLSSLLLLRFGNRTSREVRRLRAAARTLAFERLPGVVSRLRAGEELDPGTEAPPLDMGTRTLEVTETADAFSVVQRTAVQAAIEESVLRNAVNNVFRRLARRNQGLLQRQLKMLDEMERGTHDPEALAQLFRLDHLTTRMRRQAEGLIILSGAAPGRGWRQPVQVVEVMRGAVGEIEDYVRVDLAADTPDYLQGASVVDLTHLLAELIENAVAYSPPATRVQVRGGRVAHGYVIEVEDQGLGIPPEALTTLNQRLAEPPDFDVVDSDQLGLFVVSRLAARHGIQVSLRPSVYGGITAIMLLPHALVVTPGEAARLSSRANSSGRRGSAATDAIGAAPGPGPSGPFLSAPPASVAAGPGAVTAADGIPRATGALNAASRDFTSLPRRERLANLPPQFMPGAGASRNQACGSGGIPRRPSAPRSPEQARTLMSSIQHGLRTGRNANVSTDGNRPDNGGPRGNGPDGRTR